MSTDRQARFFAWILPRYRWVVALSLAWAVAGFLAFRSLPRDLFPDLSLSTLSILVQSPGGAATELELTVAQPVEQAMGGLPGVRRVTSTVQPGVVQIVVAFEVGEDPWRARQLVAERLTAIAPGFPAGTAPPLVTSAAGRLQEILEIVLEGPSVEPMTLRDITERLLVPRLQAVRGVARVERLGGGERQLQVTLAPERLRLYGVGLDAVVEALEGSHQDVSAGILEVEDKSWLLSAGTLAGSAEEVRRLPLRGARGSVTLGELADVREGPGFRQGLARHDGHEDVSLRVVKQPSAPTLTTARAVRDAVDELRRELPAGTSLELVYDQSVLVAGALSGVSRALLLGSVFVALVMIGLLGNLRAAFIVLALLPLATLGAAIPLHLLGMGLNAMTLGGLAIAVGLLVDSGVIMVENLVHRLGTRPHAGEERRAVLAAAAAEVALPVVTAVLVILVVFVPLLAIGGIAGRLYAPLALSVASSMTVSLVLSFTLVPALAARLLPEGSALGEPRFVSALKRVYAPILKWALRHGALVRAAALLVTVPCIVIALRLGSDFLPALDEGALMIQSRLPPGTSLGAVDAANTSLEQRLETLPGVRSVYRRTGRGDVTEDPMPTTMSDVLVILEEGVAPEAMMARAAEAVEDLPFGVEVTTPMQMRISEGIGGTPADLQVKLFAADLAPLESLLPELAERLERVKGVAAAAPEGGGNLPRWRLVPDDDALRRLAVPRSLVTRTLRAALQGLETEPRLVGAQRVARVVRFPGGGVETLRTLPIVLDDGRVVELGQVAAFREESAPSVIRREGAQRRVAINLRVERDLGGTARRVEAELANAKLPPGVAVRLGGKIEEARETQARLLRAIAAALVLVIVLLTVALGSFREVAVVLATLPDAFAGGLLALWIAGETWNVSSIVGLIGLFGVAVQNGLVLITQAKELQRRGAPFADAVFEASLGRVRPKLMTAGAAILGLTPMLLGFGGGELERPLAVVMVGGLVTSTIFTLIALPSFLAWVGGGQRKSVEA